MKKIILPIVAAVSSMALHVHAQVGVNTEQPATTFDITAKNATGTTKNVDGLLIPRVDRERAQNMSSIPTSTLIYINSAATGTQTGTAVNIDAVGYYYYNGTAWTKLTSTASNNIYNTDGTLTGNRIVTQGTNTIAFNGTSVNAFSVDGTTLSVDASNDRLGVGTASPAQKLSVVDTGNGNQYNGIASFMANNATIGVGIGWGGIQTVGPASTPNQPLSINSRGSGNISMQTAPLVTGNVGIGTSTPQKKLHVDGDLQITKELNVGGSGTAAGSAGTAGQILTSSGAGAAPTWITPAAVTSTNIYNADGTLTGNRIVTQGANTIAFNGTAVNAFSVDGSTFSVDAANNRVGIGTNTPNAPLQLANSTANRKIVLYDGYNNDNQYFGFGINNGLLRYQTDLVGSDHAFFAGTSATASQELMRIKGNGNVGIGTATPQKMFHVTGASQFSNEINVGGTATTPGSAGTAGQILTSAGAGAAPTWTTPTVATSTNIYNADGTLTGNRIVTQGANTIAFNGTAVNAFSVDGGTLSVDAANNRVGIGTTSPNAELQLSNGTGNRKIVLWDSKNNDNQYFGLGINSSLFRYQTDATTADHAFFAGTGIATSQELMRIKGNGNVGIGTSTPQKMFHVTGASQFSNEINVGGTATSPGSAGTAGQILTSAGAGAAPTWTTPAVVTSTNIYNADGTLTGNRTVTQGTNALAFTGTGNIGIGVAAPAQKLSVVDGTNNNQYSGIASFLPANSTQGVGIGWAGIRKIGTQTNSDFNIDAAGTGNIALQTQATGNVGIGTTAPSAKLHVVGTARITNTPVTTNAGNAKLVVDTNGNILSAPSTTQKFFGGPGTTADWTNSVPTDIDSDIFTLDKEAYITLPSTNIAQFKGRLLRFYIGGGALGTVKFTNVANSTSTTSVYPAYFSYSGNTLTVSGSASHHKFIEIFCDGNSWLVDNR